jgi:hypothetical protein
MSTQAFNLSGDSHKMRIFLNCVAMGQQDMVESLLRENPKLALMAGDVTDHAGRAFENITGFQYAVWALDWHMWKMMKEYLPYKAAEEQAEGFTRGSWVKDHGQHIIWKELLDALQKYCDDYNGCNEDNYGDYGESSYHWIEYIGKSQYKLPVHVLQEYCNPNRPFNPCPDFASQYALVRKLPDRVSDGIKQGGFDFGIFRYDGDTSSLCSEVYDFELESYLPVAKVDRDALSSLYNTRVKQRCQLMKKLVLGPLLNSLVVTDKDGEVRPLLFQPAALNYLVLGYVDDEPW